MPARGESLIAKYYQKLYAVLKTGKGYFLYRGQEEFSWPLLSAATRRLHRELGLAENGVVNKEVLISYHKRQLLDRVRRYGWHYEPGMEGLGDLELLALLQHQGAATCLLDFTARFDVALWFACRGMGKKEINTRVDGKVFIIDAEGDRKPPDLVRISREQAREKKIGNLLNPSGSATIWHWEPQMRRTRILSQGSHFLIFPHPNGSPQMTILHINIEKKDKVGLLDELGSRQDLNNLTVFPDLQGFASDNSSETPLPETEVHVYQGILNRAGHNKGDNSKGVRK